MLNNSTTCQPTVLGPYCGNSPSNTETAIYIGVISGITGLFLLAACASLAVKKCRSFCAERGLFGGNHTTTAETNLLQHRAGMEQHV